MLSMISSSSSSLHPRFHRLVVLLVLTLFFHSTCIHSLHSLSFFVSSNYPPLLTTTEMSYTPARFGQHIPENGLNLTLVPGGIDLLLCNNNMTYPSSQYPLPAYNNTSILALRGQCPFVKKASNAERLGAKLMILYSCAPPSCSLSPLDKFGLDTFVMQSTGEFNPSIPSISITYTNGNMLANALRLGYRVSIFIPGTGVMDASEKEAFREILSNFALPRSLSPPTIAGGLIPWWEFLRNTSIDPCTNRVWGVWCINSRMVMWDGEQYGATGALSHSLAALTQLQLIILRSNNITSLPDIFNQNTFTRLNEIYLDFNSLTSLPPSIGTLSNSLYRLSARYNKISSIPNTFIQLESIRVFDLCHNSISTFFRGEHQYEMDEFESD